jgi:hypothetical protein
VFHIIGQAANVLTEGSELAIKKTVVLGEALKLAFGVYLVYGVLTGWIDYIAAGRIVGVAFSLAGLYMIVRSSSQEKHSNLALRLRGDENKIPTTQKHRILTVSLATVVMLSGLFLVWMGITNNS